MGLHFFPYNNISIEHMLMEPNRIKWSEFIKNSSEWWTGHSISEMIWQIIDWIRFKQISLFFMFLWIIFNFIPCIILNSKFFYWLAHFNSIITRKKIITGKMCNHAIWCSYGKKGLRPEKKWHGLHVSHYEGNCLELPPCTSQLEIGLYCLVLLRDQKRINSILADRILLFGWMCCVCSINNKIMWYFFTQFFGSSFHPA